MGCSSSAERIGSVSVYAHASDSKWEGGCAPSESSSTKSLCVNAPDTPQDPLPNKFHAPLAPIPSAASLASLNSEIWFKPRQSSDVFTLDQESFKILPVPTFSASASYDTTDSAKKRSSFACAVRSSFDSTLSNSSKKRQSFDEEYYKKQSASWKVQEGSWYAAPRPSLKIEVKAN